MNSENQRAILRLHLKEELLAYELETVIDVINETYTSLRWLELAELHPGAAPYGDSTFAFEEFLRVKRVEIGTPNFMELYGLHHTLVQTLTYLASIGGVVGIVVKEGLGMRKTWLEIRLKELEIKEKEDPTRKQLEKMKMEADLVKARLETEKLRLEIESAKKQKIEPILEKTIRLNINGKVSASALEYKAKQQEAIAEKSSYRTTDNVVDGWDLIPD
jgi:hypothetical protein